MRILKIRVQNINSLQGNWEIDFENPAYAAGGLFAICGPTGAGKSSLLDAVCIALYGQTPRLGGLSSGANEAMTRGSGLMESEVTFLAKGVRYRALYAQRRARQKADGRLQGPAVELSQWNPATHCWDILEGKYKKHFDELIEKITGLSFAQFTRSVLLAQGSFSIFLKANEDERSAALEALTGTELYSDISRAVHERHKAEQTELERLRTEAQATNVLSDETLAKFKVDLAAAQTSLTQETAALRAKQALRERVAERDKTEAALAQSRNELTILTQSIDNLLPAYRAAQTARRALTAQPAYTALTDTRSRVAALKESEQELACLLNEARAHLSSARQAHEPALKTSQAKKQSFEALAPVLTQVRRLDTLLAQQRKTLEEKKVERAKEDQSLKTALDKRQADTLKQQALAQEIATLTRETAPETKAALLSARRAEISAALTRYEQAEINRSRREALLAAARKTHTDAQGKLEAERAALKPAGEALEAARRDLLAIEAQRAQAAGGQTLQDITRDKRLTDERLLALEALQKKRAEQDAKTGRIEQKRREAAKLDAKLKEAERMLEAKRQCVAAAQDAVKAREALEEMRSVVERLSLERSKLADGSPCPLCGALHHPYREHGPALPPEDAQALPQALKVLQNAQDALTDATRRRALLEGSLAAERDALAALEKEAAAWQTDIQTRADALTLSPLTDERLSKALSQTQTQSATLAEQLAKLSSLTDRHAAQSERLQACQAALEAQSKALREAELKAREAEGARATAQEERTAAQTAAEKAHEALKSVCAGLVKPPADASVIAGWKRLLEKETAGHEARVQRLTDRKTEAAALTSSLAEQEAQHTRSRARLAELDREIATAQAEWETTVCRRKECFGDKNPDEEEKRARDERDKALAEGERLAQRVHRHTDTVNALTGRLASASEQLKAESAKADAALSAWETARTAAGFADEASWREALLSAEDIQARLDKYTHLTAKKETLTNSLAALESRRDALRQEIAADVTLEAINEELATLGTLVSSLTEHKGSLAALLANDSSERQRLAGRLAAVKAQEQKLAVWTTLNDLIGSSDGKQYRRFVQSMTFETLLYYANRALAKITPRYLLKKDAVKPLRLNVIDAYQGGVERSAENLSGGESFLVSLALALGLSEMAGRNVRVESLFLDEGFGSLDPDTLEDAMNALSALQSQGKMIGIISHVGQVRERIPTIIEVTPGSGGVSTLSGPGVTRLPA